MGDRVDAKQGNGKRRRREQERWETGKMGSREMGSGGEGSGRGGRQRTWEAGKWEVEEKGKGRERTWDMTEEGRKGKGEDGTLVEEIEE